MELCFTSSVRFLQPGLLLKVRRVQLCGTAAVLCGALCSAVGLLPWHGLCGLYYPAGLHSYNALHFFSQ